MRGRANLLDMASRVLRWLHVYLQLPGEADSLAPPPPSPAEPPVQAAAQGPQRPRAMLQR